MRKISNKKIAAVALGAVALTGTGVAYAYWTTTGTGTGSATTAAPTGVLTVVQTNGAGETVEGAGAALTGMFPGDVAQTVTGLITNANPESYRLDSVTVKVASVTTQAGAPLPGCSLTDYLLGDGVADAAGVTLTNVAGELVSGAKVAFSLPIQFNNKPAVNQNLCKGAKVNLSFVTNAA